MWKDFVVLFSIWPNSCLAYLQLSNHSELSHAKTLHGPGLRSVRKQLLTSRSNLRVLLFLCTLILIWNWPYRQIAAKMVLELSSCRTDHISITYLSATKMGSDWKGGTIYHIRTRKIWSVYLRQKSHHWKWSQAPRSDSQKTSTSCSSSTAGYYDEMFKFAKGEDPVIHVADALSRATVEVPDERPRIMSSWHIRLASWRDPQSNRRRFWITVSDYIQHRDGLEKNQ